MLSISKIHSSLWSFDFTVSRTDSRGRFTIRGIAPGKYHIFGLMDGNQNYLYDSKTEMIAFCDSIIIPSMEAAVRQDFVGDTAPLHPYHPHNEYHEVPPC